jgi:ABC-2 type transport system ATP-binding protein
VAELKNYPQVEEWQVIPPQNRVKVSFSGNAQASAELLKVLIMAGLPISEFQQTQEDLESIFLKLGHQQAS